MESEFILFDYRLKHLHRERSSLLYKDHNFLIHEITKNLVERFGEEIVRKFPTALYMGCRDGYLSEELIQRAWVQNIIFSDYAEGYIRNLPHSGLLMNDEFISFAPSSIDLVINILNLHWVNDLPGSLIQIKNCLKKDGLFMAAIFGGETLRELRQVITQVEIEEKGGVSPRISPFVSLKDAAALLQRAGFRIPVADSELITVTYDSIISLMKDLRGMGETNALVKRDRNFITRNFLDRISYKYRENFSDSEGRIPATFEIIYITGWS